MFILIFELNNIFKFNISKHTWWILFIYVAKYICNLIYHAWTFFLKQNIDTKLLILFSSKFGYYGIVQIWAFYRGCASTNMCKYIISNLVVIHLLTLWKPYYLSHEEQKYLVECQWKNKKNVKWVLQFASLHWSLCAFL
jgi:fatty acid desaturase